MTMFSVRANILALVCDVYCDFATFPFGMMGQVWYLLVSIPNPCCLSYFVSSCDTVAINFARTMVP